MTRLLLCLLFLGLSFTVLKGQSARLIVSSPVRGAVYQQNGNGVANVVVQGSFNSSSFWFTVFSTAQATLTKLDLINGDPIQPETKLTVPLTKVFGFFFGSLSAPVGWYRLDVVVKRGNETLGIPYSSKVGVGEVFIICGQSNAQGLSAQNLAGVVAQPAPTMDAVRVQPDLFGNDFVNAATTSRLYDVRYLSNFPALNFQRPVIGELKACRDDLGSTIGPLGGSLWLWASLGEKIAREKQVPVAFYLSAGH